MFEPTTLFAGGALAAVAAGWSQVKAGLSWLSSFVVTQADIDETLSYHLRKEIRAKWKMLPSGQNFYTQRYIQFVGAVDSTIVPFKLPGRRTVWFKGFCVLLVSDDDSTIRLSYLRGTFNLERMLTTRLQEHEKYRASIYASVGRRFRVITEMGRDKTLAYQERSDSLSSSSGAVPARGNNMPTPDASCDKSFMYDNELWSHKPEINSPFDSLYYSDEVMRYVKQARAWMLDKDWYAARGIPWRRGWLLHGAGGTGKTKLAIATAQELDIPVYQFFLSTMSDQEFIKAWQNMATPCMPLLEDFDTVFEKRTPVGNTSLTFDTVLNMISGAQAMNGVFLVVTTNRLDMIDEAMGISNGVDGVSTRPGRIDTVVEVGDLNAVGRKALAHKILRDWPDLIEQALQYQSCTPAVFQEMCLQLAQQRKHDETSKDNGFIAIEPISDARIFPVRVDYSTNAA